MSESPKDQRYAGRIGDWVLYNNHQLIAFNKPGGLAVQPDRSGDLALSQMGAAYTRTNIQAVHRLDRPVSGVILMAKKASAQTALTKQFTEGEVKKTYLAIVAERPAEDAGTLEHFLLEQGGKSNQSKIVSADTKGARKAILDYRYLGSSERYHLLEVMPQTGRKHQIRVQLASIGCPIRGDKKYGFKRSLPGGIIDLHAWKITFAHPVSKEEVALEAPLPTGPVWQGFNL